GTSTVTGVAFVPSTQSMNLGAISGVQVTGGVSFIDDGSVEVSAFMLARKSSGFAFHDLGETFVPTGILTSVLVPNFIATSTLVNGQVSDHLLLYDSYQAVFQTQLWGAEANYLYDLDAVGGLQFRPLIGVRYINLTERLTQTGVFLSDPPI